jgi:hypothetical protein
MKRTAKCYPSADEINALPGMVRQYIHDLVTRCDKGGDVQTIAILREDRDALQRRVEELEAEKQKHTRKQNPDCPVPHCKGRTPHENNPTVVHLVAMWKEPALLAAYAFTGLSSLKNSIERDIEKDDVVAWLTRSRQVEELYVRAIYALFIATEDEIPHFFSEEQPNSLAYIYKQVNDVAFAGKGRLHVTSDDPDLQDVTVLNLFNQIAHLSFASLLLAGEFYKHPERTGSAAAFAEGAKMYSYFLQKITNDFTIGKTRDAILRELRSAYESS